MSKLPTDHQAKCGVLFHPGDYIRRDQLAKCDVVFYPVDYSTESTPTVRLAIDDHLGNNRFSISLSLRRAEFILAHETGEVETCEAIASDIVNTVCREYNGRFLEVVSTQDWTFMELDQEYGAVKRVMIALHNLSQIPFCPPAVAENEVVSHDDVDEEAVSVKDALAFHMFESTGTPNSDDSPMRDISSSFESLPAEFYESIQPRADYLEVNSMLSSKSGTASNLSITYSSGKQDSTASYEKSSSSGHQSSFKSVMAETGSSKKVSKTTSTSTTSSKKGRKKRVIQRRGLLKFNSDTSSKLESKQKPSSKLNVDLGDSRFAIDPSLSQIFHKAASEGQSTEITDFVTTNSYCGESTASDPQNRKRPGALDGLRSTWLKKLNVGQKRYSKHYSASEADILETDNENKVKRFDDDTYRDISSYDVLCQNEPTFSLITDSIHVGNSRMKVMMQHHREKYHSSYTTNRSKQSIVDNLVTQVTNGTKGAGSFIAKESEECSWHELDRQMACLMVEGTLVQCEHDSSILDLPNLSTSKESSSKPTHCDNFIGGRYHTALMNLKNRKKKRTLSSKMCTESIEDLQKRMLKTAEEERRKNQVN